MASIKIKLGSTSTSAIGEAKPYVYKDVDPTFTKNDNKTDITAFYDLSAIYESLANILTYKRGERILNTEFGINLQDYLYENISESIADSIGIEISNAIKKYEPRIAVTQISVIPHPAEYMYDVSIEFKCLKLNPSKQEIYNFPLRLKNISRVKRD